ncbi:1-acyl-sn-glycerol-3-phosphate acyltransferase [Aquisalimonas asiatica]|uniref:Glycerol-3-phosphate acyltransferase n=1 Tax=Aquisalimonas asiatica TaxID=406100 RepID=A0A1H8RQW7_9GAMM|nr:1-acyl-sn-glycerol-3-phosphate acyltransferase [Aquisalimonas asiatica]SEO68716.1 glycerol-3-phosphate acyltransferase [Aquisalimonas asiatica]
MTEPVQVPYWLLLVMLLITLWAVLARLLIPTVRWFFRRRLSGLIEEVNRRLHLKLPTFSLTKREVLIDRLAYDPRVLAAVRTYCEDNGTPWAVALRRVDAYAREIVPAFNAYVYFRLGNRLARAIVRRFYQVRLAYRDERGLANIDPDASIVFVMNHRSNMDYVLVAYLAEDQTALSYAVGEWARVWPLEPLVRAMGAYFVRRNDHNALYRRVLERYVQMAVDGGVVQAVFPEAGLSRDGALRAPRAGLLDYMLRDFNPGGERDILFIPVGLTYDRVVEDQSLLAEAHGQIKRRSTVRAMGQGVMLLLRNVGNRLTGRADTMGHAAAGFGTPVSARAWCQARNADPRFLPPRERLRLSRAFAGHVMECIGEVTPILPVPLLCWLLTREPGREWSREALDSAYAAVVRDLESRGRAAPYIPIPDPSEGLDLAIAILRERNAILETDHGGFTPAETARPLLEYYANSIEHLLRDSRVADDPAADPDVMPESAADAPRTNP